MDHVLHVLKSEMHQIYVNTMQIHVKHTKKKDDWEGREPSPPGRKREACN